MPSVLVAGASGYTGALAAAILQRHPRFDLVAVTSRSDVGVKLSDLYPYHRVGLELEELDLDRHGDVDTAVVAYPHGASAPVVAALRERGVRVVDLSADFRLRDRDVYESWYVPHAHPELIWDAVYGLPELRRAQIEGADLVANPGCFPTAALLALAPLAPWLADVVIDAKTGVSGAGRTPSARTHFVAANENVAPYGVGGHRHTPEIDQELASLGALAAGRLHPQTWGTPEPPRAGFFAIKGLLGAVCEALRVEWSVEPATEPFLHPGRSARILSGPEGEPVGWLGELHPLVAREYDIADAAAAFEVDLGRLIRHADAVPTYRDLTSFPALRRDLAIAIPIDTPAERLLAVVRESGAPLLDDVRLFDLYTGEQAGQGRKSIAMRLVFRAPDRTLTDDEVDAVVERIVGSATEALGGELRA